MSNENKHSEDYLNSISKNKDPFTTPDSYFATIEDRVLTQLSEEELPSKNAYVVPSNYFKNFEDTLFSRSEFHKKKPKVITFESRIRRFIPTAAAACILFFIGFNYFYSTAETTFDNISGEELELWFLDSNLDGSSRDLLEFIDIDFTENDLLEDDTSINDEDIIAYLNTISDSSLLTEIETQP
mgnify:CR=1 FL=1